MSQLIIGIVATLIVIVPVFVWAENQREKVFKSQRDKLKNHNFSLFQQVSKLTNEKDLLEKDLNLARQAAETFTVGTLMPAKTVKLGYTQGLYSAFDSEIELVKENIKHGLADTISPFISWTIQDKCVRGSILVVDHSDN